MNYANCDMVGHTGVWEAAVKAVERSMLAGAGRPAILEKGGVVLITADHGNAELMVIRKRRNPDRPHNLPHRSSSLVTKEMSVKNGILADIAPTVLELLGLDNRRNDGIP